MSQLKIISSQKQLDRLISYCKQTKYACVDFETQGKFEEPGSFPTILGVSFQIGGAWILPLGHRQSQFKEDYIPMLKQFGREVMEDPTIVKVAWNAAFEEKWFMKYGVGIRGRWFDGMYAKYLLDEERPHGLKEVSSRYYPDSEGYDDAVGSLKNGSDSVDLEKLAKYCGMDCDLELRLMMYLERKLWKANMYKLFRNLLMPNVHVLSESEFNGIPVDREYLKGLMTKYEGQIVQIEKGLRNNRKVRKYERLNKDVKLQKLIDIVQSEIDELEKSDKPNAGRLIAARETKLANFMVGNFNNKKEREMMEPINFASPNQLIDLLYESDHGFNFKVPKYTKDKDTKKPSDRPSTDEEALLVLDKKDNTGFITGLLELRGKQKIYGTYVKGIYEQLSSDNKLHASFHQLTVTGRLGCREPNLQNIPRGTTAKDIKMMFIPPPGTLILEIDYSQAELRVVAEMAHEDAMIDIFKRNFNIHVATACKINYQYDDYAKIKGIIAKAEAMEDEELDKPENKDYLFWKKEKKRGKILNFSILYGQSDDQTAIQMGVSKDEAIEFKEAWFREFPGIKKWMKKQESYVKENGFVYNLFGRKRRLPDISHPKQGLRNKAVRDSINAPIQGSASDFTQLSAVKIHGLIKRGELPGIKSQLYTVHDSIGYAVEPEHIHNAVKVISKVCENPDTLKYFGFEMKEVVMKVSAEVGKTWGSLVTYDAWENYKKWLH